MGEDGGLVEGGGIIESVGDGAEASKPDDGQPTFPTRAEIDLPSLSHKQKTDPRQPIESYRSRGRADYHAASYILGRIVGAV